MRITAMKVNSGVSPDYIPVSFRQANDKKIFVGSQCGPICSHNLKAGKRSPAKSAAPKTRCHRGTTSSSAAKSKPANGQAAPSSNPKDLERIHELTVRVKDLEANERVSAAEKETQRWQSRAELAEGKLRKVPPCVGHGAQVVLHQANLDAAQVFPQL